MKLLFALPMTLLFLAVSVVHAETALVQYSFESAKQLAKESKWEQAEAVAEKVSSHEPKNVQNWYLLGVIENRLENPIDAANAFSKVVELDPRGPLAKSLDGKLSEFKAKSVAEKEFKYGSESSGFMLEFIPALGSALANQVGVTLGNTFGIGFKIGKLQIAYRRGTADVSKIFAVPLSPQNLNPKPSDYRALTGTGSFTMQELYFNYLIPIVEPYQGLSGLAISLPIFMGVVMNTVKLGSNTFGSVGYDLASGVHLNYYTRSPFLFDLGALYHVGLPFWGIRDTNSNVIEGSSGTLADAGVSGFELSLGVTFLFGKSHPPGYRD